MEANQQMRLQYQKIELFDARGDWISLEELNSKAELSAYHSQALEHFNL